MRLLTDIIQLKQVAAFFTLSLMMGLGLFFSSCKSTEEPVAPAEPENKDNYLVKSELIGEYTPKEIQNRYGYSQVAMFTKHNVKVYKLFYNTTGVDNNKILASGALMVPVTTDSLPLISQQHGTITSEDAAPSNYKSGSEAWRIGTLLASTGTVVSAPDYIGYGASKDQAHPYEHANSLASASRDMLRAVREFGKNENLKLNNKLFLTGYSEGGYATMALHKLLEEKHSDEFTVTASAPGAGAYDKSTFADSIINSNKPLNFINSYLWVLQTYNKVYGINRPNNYYLNEPYASKVTAGGVHVDVAKNPQTLFTDTFRMGVVNKTDTPMLNAFKDNDIYDWKPKAPLALFHGTADDYVPFFNSQHAYDAMKARGAQHVELRPIKGGNHFSSVSEFTMGVLFFFSNYLD